MDAAEGDSGADLWGLLDGLPENDRQVQMQLYGDSASVCNYCKAGRPGRWAFHLATDKNAMTPHHYEAMIQRGWRRSGTLLYQPCDEKACCPQYAIRLRVDDFVPRKSHGKVKRRMANYLAGAKQGSDPHTLQIQVVPAEFRRVDFEVYSRYQQHVHQEDEADQTEERYRSFLVDSPLKSIDSADGLHMGSFHMRYLLDDRLVAIGVLDITPNYLSSVYLFYDPAVSHLSLGVFAALREIEFARSLKPKVPFYTMGLYASCPKMSYKAAYGPAELLDSITYNWVPYHICKPLLDVAEYSCFTDPERTLQRKKEEEAKARLLVGDALVCLGPNKDIVPFRAVLENFIVPKPTINAMSRLVSAAGYRLASEYLVAKLR